MSSPNIETAQSKWLTRGVLGIGLTSLFSDWSHEAATAILPAFLTSLGAPAVTLGVIEGVSDGLSSFAKLAGGFVANHPRLRKPTGVCGYLATALTTFGYAFTHSWPAVLVFRAIGWMGRGGRGPARDTLLADCVSPIQEGRAFGFERAMDTLGAVLGPLSATLLLATLSFRGVFRWTLAPGTAAVLSFVFLVPKAASDPTSNHSVKTAGFRSSLTDLSPRFWHFLAAVFAHGVGDFAPTLLILRSGQILATRFGTVRAAAFAVSLYTFYNVINALVSYPAGALGDRIGKRGLLAIGYATGALTFVGFIFYSRPQILGLGILFGLAGIHGAFQASLEKSLASELLPTFVRGSGFGILAAANGVGDLISSVVVGALWSAVSPTAGFLYAASFALLGVIILLVWR
jgi:MFS family permease